MQNSLILFLNSGFSYLGQSLRKTKRYLFVHRNRSVISTGIIQGRTSLTNLDSTIFPKLWRSPSKFSILLQNTSRYVLQSACLKTKNHPPTFCIPYRIFGCTIGTVHQAPWPTAFLINKQESVIPTLHEKLWFMVPHCDLFIALLNFIAFTQLRSLPPMTKNILQTENFLFNLKLFISSTMSSTSQMFKSMESRKMINRMKE